LVNYCKDSRVYDRPAQPLPVVVCVGYSSE